MCITAITTPSSATVTLLEFETLFLLELSEVHLLFTFKNRYVQKDLNKYIRLKLSQIYSARKEKYKYTLKCDREFIRERNVDIPC